ncbi:MAG: lamin tail domain-containing protein [Verrucomicrobia bacterium]|nr:lamin tail domain-containing protein [Verrucomicrobiota bacterium]
MSNLLVCCRRGLRPRPFSLLALLISASVAVPAARAAAPPNDNFANATVISGTRLSVNGNNGSATSETGEPTFWASGGTPSHSVWWRWTAPSNGPVEINTTNSSFDTIMAVFTGSAVTSLSCVASNDDFTAYGSRSRVLFTAAMGTVYQIAVDGYNGATGSVTLNLSQTNQTLTSRYGGLGLNGSSQWAEVVNTANLGLSRFTLETWFFWRGYGATGNSGSGGVNAIPLITKGRGEAENSNLDCNYFFGIQPNGILAADFEEYPSTGAGGLNHPIYGATAATSNTWHHAAVTYDGANWAIYLDGVLEGSLDVGRTPRFDSIQRVAFGSALTSLGAPQGFFAGTLDEVRIWSYARSDVQIASDLGRTITSAPGLIGRWSLDETNGVIAHDSSGNLADGVITNGAVWAQGYAFVAPPSVILSTPTNNAWFPALTNIPITAFATDPDGTVASILFYAGTNLLGARSSSPFSFTWSNVSAGFYLLTAVGVDNAGQRGTSAPVSISVGKVLGSQWVAYNDYFSGPGTHLNATAWNPFDTLGGAPGSVGPLKNIQNGLSLPVTLSITQIGAGNGGTAATPAFGTPAYNTFNAYIDWVAAASGVNVLMLPTNSAVIYTFTGLDPGKRYGFKATGLRGHPAYTNRWSLFEITGADFFAPSHTANVLTLAQLPTQLAPSQAVMSTGDNTSGDLIAWDNIQPGADGTFSVTSTKFNGDIPGTSTDAPYSYGLGALRLEEFVAGAQINLTGPPEDAFFILPTNVVMTAAPNGFDTPVTNVAFYAGAAKLGDATSAPYTFTWSDPIPGNYALIAVGVDGTGLTVTSAVVNIVVASNYPPSVALANPVDNASFLAPAAVVLMAAASDDLGMSGVRFYSGTNLIGSDNASPYSVPWTGVPAGSYALTAVAQDIFGLTATSAVAHVTVTNDMLPVVALTSPTNSQVFYGPTNIALTATASDVDGTIARVEFFQGAAKIGESTTPPYSATWSNVIVGGTFPLRAIATDRIGMKGTSDIVSIVVIGDELPVATITSPPDGSYFREHTNVTVTASATDSDGSVTQLVVTANGTVLGAASGGALSVSWTNVSLGTYDLLAIATDNLGVSSTSAVVQVTVVPAQPVVSLIPLHSVWKYNDAVTAEIPGWTQRTFNDNAWSSGPAELGYGDNDEATVVSFGPSSSNKRISTYFRRAFAVGAPLPFSLRLQLRRDDGGVVYLNGTEVFRSPSLPAPPTAITYRTLANVGGTPSDNMVDTAVLSPSLLVPGTNVIAVEIHQAEANSSDLSFDLELLGITTNAPPSVSFLSPADNAVFTEPADITLTATAGDADGSVTNVALFVNGTRVSESATPPYTYTLTGLTRGSYSLQATARDNWGQRGTSAIQTAFVVLSSAPTVEAFLPPGGTVSALTQIEVHFSEPVMGVDAADLLINGLPASAVSGANTNYLFTFPQPPDGAVSVSWALGHGITDRETQPQPFDGTKANETVRYTLVDTVSPTVVSIRPAPGATVKSLTRVDVVFSEAVGGVTSGDLLINGTPATRVSGSLFGPYVFEFTQPATGVVQFAWAAQSGIHDFAAAQNRFAGGSWTCTLDPNISEAGLLITEIMYHPGSENVREEYVELLNTNSTPLNLAGWRLTGGIGFDFPAVTVPAGGYLVVAADVAVFQAKYPNVTAVIGGWTGRLGNGGDTVRVRNALDDAVATVTYANEGDWAIRQRGPLDNGSRGWEWIAGHDGNVINTATGQNDGNRSLELVNTAMPNDNGQNWRPSIFANGSPGQVNSRATDNAAPLIYDVTHFPPVPNSTDTVTLSARVVDELPSGVTVQLFYRDHSVAPPEAFAAIDMFDDATHGDTVAGDRVFTVQLPPMPDHTVIEFYVSATDSIGNGRTWPAAARLQSGGFSQQANAQFQVDDEINVGTMPFFRLVMTETERNEFYTLNSASDAEMNATFITTDGVETEVRYNCGARIRGAGSRGRPTRNRRVNIPNDRLWEGYSEINLNVQYIHAQLAGSRFSLASGQPCATAVAVQFRVNGNNHAPSGVPPQSNGDGAGFGTCLFVEPIGGEWAGKHFPDDPAGNVYRGSRYPWTANLSYRGAAPNTYINEGYSKTSNRSDNDWTDLFALTYALNDTNNPAYVEGVLRNANVRMFMRYFAVSGLINYWETSMCRGVGDDYAMYRGVNDPRFMLVAHDFDTVFSEGDSRPGDTTSHTIWSMLNPPSTDPAQAANFLFPFMRHPEFAPLYYEELQRLLDTTFHPAQMARMMDDALTEFVPAYVIERMKTFVTNRAAYVRSQIPQNLTVSTALGTLEGYLYTTASTVTLTGRANAIRTRSVSVNGQPVLWSAFSAAWTNVVALQPGLNRLLVQALDTNNVVFEQTSLDIWYDTGATADVSGALFGNVTWSPASGPYHVTGNLTITDGATLTIQPGTTVFLAPGVNLTVANGGRLLADGTEGAPIRFARVPGGGNWGGITVNGGVRSPETRIAHAVFEGNGSTAIHSTGGTVFLDHLTFRNTAVQYVSLDGSSFVVQDCVFPTATTGFELVHGTGGIKDGGRGLFLRNFFGRANGYNDVVDFTGGNRPGPIVQFIDNVFTGSGDDHLDLDGTDAWIEGNIFLHAHKNGSPDSSSAISGGRSGSDRSEITIIGNLIYNCDNAANAKEGNFYTFFNNTIVRQTRLGGTDTVGAVALLADVGTPEGAGMYFEGNIIDDAEQLAYGRTNAVVTFTNNLITRLQDAPWTGPGGNNATNDPLFKYVPAVTETSNFTSWASAQVLWDWFSLRTGSPAVAAGPNGRDQGVPLQRVNASTVRPIRGASVSGEPRGTTTKTTATLTVGPNRTGSGIPASSWANGSGFTHYRWRLDGGAWSTETPITQPLALAALADGPHYVAVIGKLDSGIYQNDAELGSDATVTFSRTWVVNAGAPPVRLNEILALNDAAVPAGNRYPDLIELYNFGAAPFQLEGLGLTDNADDPFKFTFPPGAVINPGQHLVLYADNDTTPAGYHLGFTLKAEGDDVYLFAADGRLIDSVEYGLQLPDLSIGRLGDGAWSLCVPTFGSANAASPLGDPHHLKLNEWLAASLTSYPYDYIEIYNPEAAPVALGGLHFTDTLSGAPGRDRIRALSFIAAKGFTVFIADGNGNAGAEHVNFRLTPFTGELGLLDQDLNLIDYLIYGPQTVDVSQGRSPNGGSAIVSFTQLTPGGPNPAAPGPVGTQVVINEVLARNVSGLTNFDGSTPEWVELFNPTANAINLSGYGLSDLFALPFKFTFPPGASLASGEYLLVLCDDSQPASTNADAGQLNAGFGIRANGGSVYLFDATGAQLDGISYGVQARDLSIGRLPNGGTNWTIGLATPGSLNLGTSLGSVSQLKVNEWMANPAGGEDWFEIYNPSLQPVALSGLWLSDNITTAAARKKFLIAPLSFIGTGLYGYERFWADNLTADGPDHTSFKLGNGGEMIGISLPDGTLIDGYTFGVQDSGVSEGRLPDGAASIVRFPATPTPADANYLPLAGLVISEVLSASPTNPPTEDAIEILNVSAASVDITGWWLSDAQRALRKFQITNTTVLPPGGFAVFYEYQFGFNDDASLAFALDGTQGDEVYLAAADGNGDLTGHRAGAKFGSGETGVSFGRYVNSQGQPQFVAMSRRTLGNDNAETILDFRAGAGAANPAPRVGPLVISEIMYHPPDLPGPVDNVRDEFIELLNLSANAVPLYDPVHPTNTWRLRGGADFNFPPGVVVPTNGLVLVVSFDPVNDPNSLLAFQAAYPNLAVEAVLYGPYTGKLDNGGESVELQKPGPPVPAGLPDAGYVPYILVEQVQFDDIFPWDIRADGLGLSLQRVSGTGFGNDVTNWVAVAPTPGPQAADTDQDGIPDSWMQQYFGHPTGQAGDNSLANQDADGDGLTNGQEFQAGSNPRDPNSGLRLVAAPVGADRTVIRFDGVARKSYTLLFSDALPPAWDRLLDVGPLETSGPIWVTNQLPVGVTQRFYRLVTPRAP